MQTELFQNVELVATDKTMLLNQKFIADTRANKINMGIGMYLDEKGKVPLLKSVQLAEESYLSTKPARPYPPMDGLKQYNEQVQMLLFNKDSEAFKSKRIVTVGSLGGSGAIRIGADFLKLIAPNSSIYLSNPTWINHFGIFTAVGFNVKEYPYYNSVTKDLDFNAMINTIKQCNKKDIFVLHACCHNPTGIDPTEAQWIEIINLIKDKGAIPFVDFAYQGFSEGIDADTILIKLLLKADIPFLVANSFSKSFSLYAERVGGLSVVASNPEEAERILSNLKNVIRSNYSCPSTYGENLVLGVLSNPAIHQVWKDELEAMRSRISKVRKLFIEQMGQNNIDISFTKKHAGLFSYFGLNAEQIDKLREDYAIYALSSGRFCLAGLNDENISYVASSIAKVVHG